MSEKHPTYAQWIGVILSLVAVGMSGLALALNATTGNQNAANATRQVCLQWLRFVLSEQGKNIPDQLIDLEGDLLSQSTRGLLASPRLVAVPQGTTSTTRTIPPNDTIPDLCGTAEMIRHDRGQQ